MEIFEQNHRNLNEKFTFSSSIANDIWHPKKKRESYEWWYFDALSDDGNEAIAITFLDNYIFSPRYNAHVLEGSQTGLHTTNGNAKTSKFPALVFVYYRDGKAVYRAISEYPASEFSSSVDNPECTIGKNSFRFESAPYGDGYSITIDTKLGKNQRIRANFEWLSIESNFETSEESSSGSGHWWNLVAPRADVTGRITLTNKSGKTLEEINFGGTGYHDHNHDDRWLPDTLKSWQRGRVHFPDLTAVFFRYNESGSDRTLTKLLLIRDGKLKVSDAVSDAQKFSRNVFGLKYPSKFQITDTDNVSLKIKQKVIAESTFFYLRFFAEMTLSLEDGKPRKGISITEHLAPRGLKYRWLDWLTSLRLSK